MPSIDQIKAIQLPKYLFWDIDLNELDPEKHARFIIQRVIQRGLLEHWVKIKQYYGLEKIKHEILAMRSLDAKTLTFFSVYFEISKEKFRCYTIQQSTPKHYNY
jgi:hypothetical protein